MQELTSFLDGVRELILDVDIPTSIALVLSVSALLVGVLFLSMRQLGWVLVAQLALLCFVGSVYERYTDLGQYLWPLLIFLAVFLTALGSVLWAINDER